MDGMASTLAWPDKLPNLKVIIGCVYATAYRWPKKEILKDDLRENPQSAKIANFIAALFIETDTETFVETKIVSFAQIHISQSLRQGVRVEKKRRNLTGVHLVSSIGQGLLSQ